MKFKSVLEIATTNIMSVSRKDTLKAAAEIMFSHNIRNVLVVDEGITEYGIITVKDIAGFITSGVDFSNTIESLDVKSVKQIDKDMSALDASFMIRGDISYLCVVDETKKLLGIVSMSNIISSIDAELVVNDIRLGHIIGKTKAKTASQNESLKAVFEKTNATQIEAVIVIADNSVPLGIITKRDIVKLIIGGIDLSEPVGKYMKSPLVVADEDTTVKEALELMGVKKFKRLIVVEKSGELLGAITREEIMDIVYNKWSQIVREKEGELRELTRDLEAKTAESERNVKLLNDFMDATDDFIFYKGLDYKYIGCNKAFAEFAGTTKDAISGKTDFDLFDDYYADLFRSTDRGVIEKGKTVTSSYWASFKDQKAVYLSAKKSPFKDSEGNIIGLIGITRDTTEQKNMEDTIKHQHNYLQTILDMQDSMLVITKDGDYVVEANKSFLEFCGVKNIAEYRNKYDSIADLVIQKDTPQDGEGQKSWFKDAIEYEDKEMRIVMGGHKKGLAEKVEGSFLLKAEKFEREDTYLLSFVDITSLERESKNLELLAMTDPLTGVYNRMKFGNLMESEISKSRRYKTSLSLAILDIDFFKKINDTYGHQAGDYVLVTVAELMRGSIDSVDIFARWGGEEFMLLMPGCNTEEATAKAEKLRCVLAEYNFIEPPTVTASFGVSSFGEEDNMDSLIKRADDALYLAKHNGRNRVESR